MNSFGTEDDAVRVAGREFRKIYASRFGKDLYIFFGYASEQDPVLEVGREIGCRGIVVER